VPAEGLVESLGPGDVADAEGDEAEALLHCGLLGRRCAGGRTRAGNRLPRDDMKR
jgi:hypothetical protein